MERLDPHSPNMSDTGNSRRGYKILLPVLHGNKGNSKQKQNNKWNILQQEALGSATAREHKATYNKFVLNLAGKKKLKYATHK